MATVQIPDPGWSMADWPPHAIVVEGVVMALEGCGGNEDPVTAITSEGTELRILGVRRDGDRIQIVVTEPAR